MKIAVVSPVYKKNDPFNKDNYPQISVLTVLSKVFEKVIERQLSPFLNMNFSDFLGIFKYMINSDKLSFNT